jgi:hypothetical protein
MNRACSDHGDTLMLDVLGEPMAPELRREWEGHLSGCEGCRQERADLVRVLAGIRTVGAAPALSDRQADAMANAVGWQLRNENVKRRAARPRRLMRWRPLAAACALALVIVLGYHTARDVFEPEPVADLQDIEVIRHLDLLKEMDTIEKLVEVVDLDLTPAAQPPEQAPESDTQGNRGASGSSHV